MRLPEPPLLVITDRHLTRLPLPELAAAVFAGGGRWLLLRDKDLPAGERVALGRQLREIAAPHGATVLMSGDPEPAQAAGVDGVHLPRGGDVAAARASLGPAALIGFSAHDRGEAERAAAAGADYVTLSPIFASASKPGYGPALGVAGLAEIAAALPIPVLALGGITAERVPDCRVAGAAGVAVMGAVVASEDPAGAARALVRSLAEL